MEEILMEVKKQIDALLCTGKFLVIAIDGNCTAGKTTLAAMLEKMYDCNVFHMDDFFLRPEQRTPERYAQPGGNVDYERFREEVLVPLLQGGEFAYQPFSCKTFTLSEPVKVLPKTSSKAPRSSAKNTRSSMPRRLVVSVRRTVVS
jgi:hypothetical protein